MFPVIEGFPAANPFVQIILRDGDVVRVNAPGFAAQNETNPMTTMMGGFTSLATLDGSESGGPVIPDIPAIDGTFTIVTKGAIQANNTDEGAVQGPQGKTLTWQISPRTQSAPTALIDLSD